MLHDLPESHGLVVYDPKSKWKLRLPRIKLPEIDRSHLIGWGSCMAVVCGLVVMVANAGRELSSIFLSRAVAENLGQPQNYDEPQTVETEDTQTSWRAALTMLVDGRPAKFDCIGAVEGNSLPFPLESKETKHVHLGCLPAGAWLDIRDAKQKATLRVQYHQRDYELDCTAEMKKNGEATSIRPPIIVMTQTHFVCGNPKSLAL